MQPKPSQSNLNQRSYDIDRGCLICAEALVNCRSGEEFLDLGAKSLLGLRPYKTQIGFLSVFKKQNRGE